MRLLVLLALLSPAALAATPQKTLAVLEFRSKLEKDAVDVGYLTDVVRTAAKDAVPDLKVMTRENMFVLLQAGGKKMEDCEGECEVDTGRRVGADLVISGDVLKFGTQFKANMKMHDTHSGELLQGAQASGANLDELDKNLTVAVTKLLAPLGAKSSPSATAPARPPEQRSPPHQDIVQPSQTQPLASPPARRQSSTTGTAPPSEAPAPVDSTPKTFGLGVFALFGYYNWSITATSGATTNTLSTSDPTFGASAHLEYRIGSLGLGLLTQYNTFQYTNSSTGQTASSSAITLGPIGRLRVSGEVALFASIAYTTMSENQGSGVAILAGLDMPIYGVFAGRAMVSYRGPTTSGTTSGGATVDVSSAILSGEFGLGLLF